MNHSNAHSYSKDSSPERDEEGARILEHFRLTCEFFHIGWEVMNELRALQKEFDRTGFFSEESWFRFLSIFERVIETRMESNVTFLGRGRKMESKDSVNASFYKFGINIIKGYVGYLQSEIRTLQAMPMSIANADMVSETEEQIVILMDILSESHVETDWRGFRNYLDTIQSQIHQTKALLEASRLRKRMRAPVKESESVAASSSPEPSVEETIDFTREYAWGALLRSGTKEKYISNEELERIKANLHPNFSYDKITNTIITAVKHSQKQAIGGDKLDLSNPETRRAMEKILKQQWTAATPLSIEVRDDLHKLYGTRSANGELMYNTLAETFSGDATWQPIDLVVGGFSEFQVLTNERNAPNSPWYTLRVVAKRYGSNTQEILTVMCKPEEVRAGTQARFAIKTRLLAQAGETEPKYTTTIEFLDVSRIRNIRKPLRSTDEHAAQESSSLWDKAKRSVKNTWNNWFSKKAA